jgi:GT2 family glycosyltransferase
VRLPSIATKSSSDDGTPDSTRLSDIRIRARRVGTRALSKAVPPLRSFVSSRKRTAAIAQRLLDQFDPLHDGVLALLRGDPDRRYERWVAAYDTLTDADFAAMRDEQSRFTNAPAFSVILPLTTAGKAPVSAVAASLLGQVYERWEAHFVLVPPLDDRAQTCAAEASASDARFRLVPEPSQLGSDAWNTALRSAANEFVVLVDPHVLPRPHALFMLAYTIRRHPAATVVYADDDAVDDRGVRCDPYFKPDWNEALYRGQNYLGGLVAFRRSLALDVGGCEEELDGDSAWGLFLRMGAAASPETIHHIPFVLTHRPARPSAGSDQGGRERVARAQEHRLTLIGERATVKPVGKKSYRTRLEAPSRPPTVSVVVPSTCNVEVLRPCLDGLLNRTTYSALEVLLVANAVREKSAEQRDYLAAVARNPRIRLLSYGERPFNFSRVNNWAAEQARGDFVCFLNDDTEVIESRWLSAMVANVRGRVAAVGALLIFPSGRIQHAGVLLGAGGVGAHIYSRRRSDITGYHDRALIDQDVSCVTAACMLVRHDVFSDIGGFDEALAIAFNDVDLCLRLREAGWRIVWTPAATLYHKESASIGRHNADERAQEWIAESHLMQSRWGKKLLSDPHYSPNLSLDALQLWEPAFPPRVTYPWRAESPLPSGVERYTVNG